MGPCHPLEFQCKFTPKERWMSLLCGYTVGFKPTVILSGYIMFPLNPHWCPTISPLWQGMERLWGSQRNGARKQGATGLMHTWCPVSISVCWLCSVCVCTYTAYTDILMYICQYNPVYIQRYYICIYTHITHIILMWHFQPQTWNDWLDPARLNKLKFYRSTSKVGFWLMGLHAIVIEIPSR